MVGLSTGIVHNWDVLGCCKIILLLEFNIVMLFLVYVTVYPWSQSCAVPRRPCCSRGTMCACNASVDMLPIFILPDADDFNCVPSGSLMLMGL